MNPKNVPVVVNFKHPIKVLQWFHKRPWLYAIPIVIIAGAVVAVVLLSSSSQPKKLTANVCTLPANIKLLQTAAVDIQDNNTLALSPLIAKIQALPNYTKDPNCLYPLMYYYINTSDSKNSSLYLKDLKTVYNPKVGYNHVLDLTYSLKTLEVDVTNLKKVNQEIQNNAVYLPTTYKPTTNQQ